LSLRNRRKKVKKGKQSLRDTINWTYIHIVGVPEREGRQNGAERICEENSPNLMKDMNIHIQGGQQTLRRTKKSTPHYYQIVEGQRIVKATREKQFIIYKASSRKINALFLIRNNEGQMIGGQYI